MRAVEGRRTRCSGRARDSLGLGRKPTRPNSSCARGVKQNLANASAAARAAGGLASSTRSTFFGVVLLMVVLSVGFEWWQCSDFGWCFVLLLVMLAEGRLARRLLGGRGFSVVASLSMQTASRPFSHQRERARDADVGRRRRVGQRLVRAVDLVVVVEVVLVLVLVLWC